ncbi:hypothetical protein [Bacillus marasmi]|uniref:hypothetical protein n=1 Tax=Bacillus marasmi TaxID=1926279 RepID=UPI0011CA0B50|nr:hypothetical protein [Bacillus marasmi]
MAVANPIELLNGTPINPELPPSQSLMQQYEKMIVTTLLRSFALDFMIKDQDGGNVDTPLTAREYGLKDNEAKLRYKNRGDYKEHKNNYHSHKNYIHHNRQASELKDQGQLTDAYTGQKISRNEKYDLDHTIAAKEIHDDPAIYLAGLNGVDLANADTNLNHTNSSINRSKKQKSMTQYLAELKEREATYDARITELHNKQNLSDKERKELNKLTNLRNADSEKMREVDDHARKEYDKGINKAYLSQKETYINVGKDAMKTGWKMGARQALGIILAEVWAIVRKKFPSLIAKMKEQFSLKEFFLQVADVFKEAFETVKKKFKTLIASFANGMLAGVLSSISTFMMNFFMGTAKNVVKMIREFWGSITEVFNLLVFNKNQLQPGELIRAISKILVMAAAVIAGTYVEELLSKTGIPDIPVIGEALTIFLSGLTTGLISISLVYFIDHSKEVETLVKYLNTFADQLEQKREYYAEFNKILKQKVSELAQLPIEELDQQIAHVSMMTREMNLAETDEEMNKIVSKAVKDMRLKLPYQDEEGLREFMLDRNALLHFE